MLSPTSHTTYESSSGMGSPGGGIGAMGMGSPGGGMGMGSPGGGMGMGSPGGMGMGGKSARISDSSLLKNGQST